MVIFEARQSALLAAMPLGECIRPLDDGLHQKTALEAAGLGMSQKSKIMKKSLSRKHHWS